MDSDENPMPRNANRALPTPPSFQSHGQLDGLKGRPQMTPTSAALPMQDRAAEETVITNASDASQLQASLDARPPIQLATCEVPKHLGRYEVRAVLGNGAFGSVFKAFDPELDRVVAVKVPRRDLLRAPEAVDAYLAEAKILASLDHPGIVAVYDCGRTDDGLCYVVSKVVEGDDLSRLMTEKHISREKAVRIIAAVAEALHYAHKRGLVHCDIKPANILVAADGQPIVVDFGLAVREQTQSQQSGTIAGTPFYMSPEQARGERHRLDGRTDIWALGVILYELVTHRRPFNGESSAEVLDEVAHREPKPARMVDDSVPEELERIILRCLSKEIRDRYVTAADLAADLRRWIHASTSGSSASADKAIRRWRLGLLAGAVLAVAVALALLFVPPLLKRPTSNAAVGPPSDPSDDRPLQSSAAVGLGPLDGDVNVRIWSANDDRRQGLSIHEPAALPLKKEDRIRVEARLNRPAYVYILWIAADGQVSPVYPWRPGDWNQPAKFQRVTGHVSLPEEIDAGWPLDGGPGMETVLLLARDQPLPREPDLRVLLCGLPKQRLQDEHALVWLDQGELSTSRTRAPKFFDPAQLDDPVLKAQKLISQRLKAYFPLIRAVSFANKGGS